MSPLRRRLLQRLATVRHGATVCPGQLARDCGTRLASIRADLFALAESGQIILRQHGQPVDPAKIKGPFRVALKKPELA